MRSGRKRKPTALHALDGGRCRTPRAGEPRPTPIVPRPPKELTRQAKHLWRLWRPELERLGLLTAVDGPAFGMLCQSYADYLQLRADLAKLSSTVYALNDKQGRPRQYVPVPQVAMARQAMADFLRCAGEFGFTPTARAEFGGATPAENDPILPLVTR